MIVIHALSIAGLLVALSGCGSEQAEARPVEKLVGSPKQTEGGKPQTKTAAKTSNRVQPKPKQVAGKSKKKNSKLTTSEALKKIRQSLYGEPITKVDKQSLPSLIQDEKMFRRVTDLAWQQIDETTCMALIRLYKHAQEVVRQTMRRNAYRLASRPRGRVTVFSLRGPVANEQRAKLALKKVGPAAAAALAGADESSMLRQLGKKAVPYLIKAAENSKSPNRLASYFALRRNYRKAKVTPLATSELLYIVTSKHRWFPTYAVEELAERKTEAGEIVDFLVTKSGSDIFERSIGRLLTRMPAGQEKSIAWMARRVRSYRVGNRDIRGTGDFFLIKVMEFTRTGNAKHKRLAVQVVCDRLKAAWEFNNRKFRNYQQALAYSHTRIRLAKELATVGVDAAPALPTLAAIITTKTPTKTVGDKLWSRILGRERPAIAIALAKIGTAPAKKALRDALDMGYQEALEGLKLFKSSSKETKASFLTLANQLLASSPRDQWAKESWKQHKKICELLQKAGPAAANVAPVLLAKMRATDPRWKAFSLYGTTIKALGPAARKRLTEMLMNRYAQTPFARGRLQRKHTALLAEFRGIGAEAKPAVNLLVSEANKLRSKRGVISTLAEIGKAEPSVIPQMIPMMTATLSSKTNCGAAAEALRVLGPNAKAGIPALRAALFRKDKIGAYDRYRMAKAMSQIIGAQETIPHLERALQLKLFRGDFSSRKRAERLLRDLKSPPKKRRRRNT